MCQQQFTNPGFSLSRLAEFEVLVMDVAIATLISSALVLTNFGSGSSHRAVAAEVQTDNGPVSQVNPQPIASAFSTSTIDLGQALTVDCLVSSPLIERQECAVGGELFLHPERVKFQPQAIDSHLSDRPLSF